MGENSKIEWCDHTWNPWRAVGGTRVRASAATWRKPLAWNENLVCDSCGTAARKSAISLRGEYDGHCAYCNRETTFHRPRVSCGPLFEECEEPIVASGKSPVLLGKNGRAKGGHQKRMTLDDLRRDLFALIDATPYLDWILLTSIATQADADRNVPLLLACRDLVPVLGVSAEPLVGPLALGSWLSALDWVICGGESGPAARPMHPDWARGLRDQCVSAGVPFFFKQWGEWAPTVAHTILDGKRAGQLVGTTTVCSTDRKSIGNRNFIAMPASCETGPGKAEVLDRVGKKNAGRLLDGREWNEFPASREPETSSSRLLTLSPQP